MNKKSNVEKELLIIKKKENNIRKTALAEKKSEWKKQLAEKIPRKVQVGLNSAFCKVFAIVFERGHIVIEKTYNKEELKADHKVQNYAVEVKCGRKELRQMERNAKKSALLNLAATTAEGMSLGFLGIGLPDIVLFLVTLLRGIYQTALNYGFDYEEKQEQLLILKMMQTALSSGDTWCASNAEVEQMLEFETPEITDEEFERQIKLTAEVFAMDMLVLKFIQGLPIVGLLGGASNPVYYHKVMRYVELKYRKRYLLRKRMSA